MLNKYLKKILLAKVYDVAIKTDLMYLPKLSARIRSRVLLKREDTQRVFSFKLRGAFNKISSLSREERVNGVIAASAGNHAQGVALAAQYLGIKAKIVMPETAQQIKVSAVESFKASVELSGQSFTDAYNFSIKLAQESGATFIHPFDDEEVIAGQGTIAMEILQQYQGKLDAIFVPIGGGGLISGIAVYCKAIRPEIKIIGVQTDESNAMLQSLRQNRIVALPKVGLFSDGTAVRVVGEETFNICRKYLDDIIEVSVDNVCSAIKDVFEDTRTILEPAGALGLAGLKRYARGKRDLSLVTIASGANMNFDRLNLISERTAIGETREVLLAVKIPERPRSFHKFYSAINKRNFTEFSYRFNGSPEAVIFVGFNIYFPEEKSSVIEELRREGIMALDVSDDDIVKFHIRYLNGGIRDLSNERFIRLNLPESGGALDKFLTTLPSHWNITLFHYRYRGTEFSDVLVGLDTRGDSDLKLESVLNELNYFFVIENSNPAVALFLKKC